MILEAVRLVLAVGLLVLLPGWLLACALFPRPGQIARAERAYLTVAGGVLVLMLLGIILGFLPHAGSRGHLQSLALGGMPNVELATLGVSVLLAWVGVSRGAHARLASKLPTSWRSRASTGPQGPAP